MYAYTSIFSATFSKGNNFRDFLVAVFGQFIPSKIGSTLKGKNSLPLEQILPFMR